jgi:hypothetical protein
MTLWVSIEALCALSEILMQYFSNPQARLYAVPIQRVDF